MLAQNHHYVWWWSMKVLKEQLCWNNCWVPKPRVDAMDLMKGWLGVFWSRRPGCVVTKTTCVPGAWKGSGSSSVHQHWELVLWLSDITSLIWHQNLQKMTILVFTLAHGKEFCCNVILLDWGSVGSIKSRISMSLGNAVFQILWTELKIICLNLKKLQMH